MATTFDDIHPDIIHTNILPRLDGPSLSAAAMSSSSLKSLCSDDTLWSHISRSTWPSITHPCVHHLLSTFPTGHRSFFNDSFPVIITDITRYKPRRSWATPKSNCPSCHLDRSSDTWPSELISAVDIHYQNDVIYSRVNFTQITPDFLKSGFSIEFSEPDPTQAPTVSKSDPEKTNGLTRPINLTVDELSGADTATLSHLKDSITLNWIVIDPTRKRACNLSSVKPVSARQDWVTNETIIRYVTVLPGCDPDVIVRCRIQVVLGVGEKGIGLYVKEVKLNLHDLDCVCLNGVEFLKVAESAIMDENNVRRKVVDDEQRLRSYRMFKEMKKEKKEWKKKMEQKRELVICLNYFGIFVSFFFSVYFLLLLLK